MTIGTSTIRVPYWLKEFADKAKKGELPEITIVFGTQMLPFEVNVMKHIVEEFEKEYPSIKVDYENYQDLRATVQAAAAVGQPGTGPDVFTWAHDWTGEMAEAGYIIPLDQYLPPETLQDLKKQFLSVAYEAGTYKLRLYGLPWAAEAIALVINTKMVSTPPQTFDEMKTIMEKYYDPANDIYGLAYQADPYFLYPWITAFGGYYYEQINDKLGINCTGTKQGLEFYIKNILPYLDASDLGHEHQLTIFVEQRAPMMITGPWDIPSIKESLATNFKVVPLPKIDDKHVPKPFVGVKLLWASSLAASSPERLNATLLFMLWFTLNDDIIKYMVDQAGFIPVKMSVLQYINQHVDEYPIVAGFAASIARGVPMPNSPKMAKVWSVADCISAILQKYTQALNSGATKEEAINEALKSIDEIMDQCQADILESLSKG